jgi:hypothetical protein
MDKKTEQEIYEASALHSRMFNGLGSELRNIGHNMARYQRIRDLQAIQVRITNNYRSEMKFIDDQILRLHGGGYPSKENDLPESDHETEMRRDAEDQYRKDCA